MYSALCLPPHTEVQSLLHHFLSFSVTRKYYVLAESLQENGRQNVMERFLRLKKHRWEKEINFLHERIGIGSKQLDK
jgi:hypothetical protein